MNFCEKLNISCKALRGIIFRKKFPLAVGWNITYRCDLQCKYCQFRGKKVEELSLEKVLCMITELASCGLKLISFSGGEPLLRRDLPDIINFCKSKKIYVSINSNGVLIKQRIKEICNVDAIKLSLDGPRHINDAIRGPGVHDKVIEAIEICKKENIKVNIVTLISRNNISHIPYVLEVAKKYNVGVYFQPADKNGSCDSNKDILSEMPDEADYEACIFSLINEKENKNKVISNSLAGLKHLYYWPKPKKIFCLRKLFSCDIEPDGRIFICDDFPNYQKYLVSTKSTFKEVFNNLVLPYPCRQCWTASLVEFNLMVSFKPANIVRMWKKFKDGFFS